MSDEEPKLQIDDDWKSEAAAEKERLSESIESDAGPQALPEPSITSIIQLLAMQAMGALGGMRTPDGKEIPPSVEAAKYYIDLLDILDKKTSGNLEQEEKALLDTSLHQLRMAYVEVVSGGSSGTPKA